MAAVVKNSTLNPMATCFVPSGLKAFPWCESVNSKPKGLNVHEDSRMKSKEIAQKRKEELVVLYTKFLSEIEDCESKSGNQCNLKLKALPLKASPNDQKFSYGTVGFDVEILGVCSLLTLPIFYLLSDYFVAIEKECMCPSVFGWVIPPNFFGNPFNINYKCSKKYIHAARNLYVHNSLLSHEQMMEIKSALRRVNLLHKSPEQRIKNFNDITLDGDTLQDCETQISKLFHVYGSCKQSMKSGVRLQDVLCKAFEEPIKEDFHPLLHSLPQGDSMYGDTNGPVSLETVENILEKCLSPCRILEAFNGCVTRRICNPPCSIWCEYLPPAARETYKKFLANARQADSGDAEKITIGRKHLCEKSLSSNDTLKCTTLHRSLGTEAESKRLLLLRKKYPASYLKHATNELTDRRLHASSQTGILNINLKKSSTNRTSNWGRFGGVDSLWQPLPDCISASGNRSNCRKTQIRRLRSAS